MFSPQMKPWSVCSLFFCAPCGPNGSLPCCHGTRWGTGTPYFLGITLWLRNFCKAVQSLKTGCLTISPGIVQTAGHSALPPACFIISARLPSPSSPFHSPIQGNLPLVQEKTLLKTHSTKSSVSQIFWVLSRAEILETKATASSFSLIPCHIPPFGQWL